jgi:hypothetical protein
MPIIIVLDRVAGPLRCYTATQVINEVERRSGRAMATWPANICGWGAHCHQDAQGDRVSDTLLALVCAVSLVVLGGNPCTIDKGARMLKKEAIKMGENSNHEAFEAENTPRAFGIILVIILLGPVVGIIMDRFGIVLAPPATYGTIFFYLLPPVFSVLLGIAALIMRWVGLRTLLLGSLILIAFTICGYLPIIGAEMPSPLTNCEAVDVSPPSVRYECVTFSDYAPKFTIEGRAGWPLMRAFDYRKY